MIRQVPAEVRRLLGMPKDPGPKYIMIPPPPPPGVTPSKRWTVWERDNFTCCSCGRRRFLTIDHIVPRCKGGTHEIENLQTLCSRCNSKKGRRVVDLRGA